MFRINLLIFFPEFDLKLHPSLKIMLDLLHWNISVRIIWYLKILPSRNEKISTFGNWNITNLSPRSFVVMLWQLDVDFMQITPATLQWWPYFKKPVKWWMRFKGFPQDFSLHVKVNIKTTNCISLMPVVISRQKEQSLSVTKNRAASDISTKKHSSGSVSAVETPGYFTRAWQGEAGNFLQCMRKMSFYTAPFYIS